MRSMIFPGGCLDFDPPVFFFFSICHCPQSKVQTSIGVFQLHVPIADLLICSFYNIDCLF